MASQTFWEYAGYWSFAFVVICCAGEAAHTIALFSKESIHGRVGGKLWACLLVVALSAELATQVKTNSVSGQIIAFLAKQTAAAQDDTERLKNQNLILEKEVRGREILPAQERSVVAALKGKVREDVQIFTVRDPEAQIFSMNLAGLLQEVGMTGKFVVLPDPPPDQTGVMFCGDGSRDSQLIQSVLMEQKIIGIGTTGCRETDKSQDCGKFRETTPRPYCPPNTIFVGLKSPLQNWISKFGGRPMQSPP